MPKTISKTGGKRRAPAIMLQGTSSDAGKSVLAAALCRMLLQDGYRVAPFKAQNMSLNSYVTLDGRELGRAQATQAMACRLEPDASMNPVLLKPTTDVGAQVIVMGRPVANMDVGAYFRYKPEAFKQVTAAYDRLAEEFDVLVIEGAGSPAEINLKAHDIVNMRMAAYAQATVLLVADIDRGGAFASLVGTMELLEPWERELVAGFVLNRFRGDPSLLGMALDVTTQRTGKPFYGIVPYLPNLGLPEEDSVSFKARPSFSGNATGQDAVELALVDLPHISNFTDFDALAAEPDVRLRTVRCVADLEGPLDALLLPGSKSTIADLRYLEESGLAQRIKDLAATGRTEIVGVCGGYQMLGAWIEDELAVEAAFSTETTRVSGLGLLPVTTSFGQEKILGRTEATHLPSGLPAHGYEIHHGRTTLLDAANARVVLRDAAGESLGCEDLTGRIWGAYLHGLFDADGMRRWFLNRLRQAKGLRPEEGILAPYDLEPALDRLAACVRNSLEWKKLYAVAGIV
jgi:adenosylcobyric acid synthase